MSKRHIVNDMAIERPARTARFGFRIEGDLAEWVEVKAAARRISVAQQIRDILYTVKQREEAGETFTISILGPGRIRRQTKPAPGR